MRQQRLNTLTILAGSSLTVMAGATISPSLPALTEHFADIAGAADWARRILTVPGAFIVMTAPIAGVIIDRIGPKPVFLLGLVLYILAGTSGLWLDSITGLLVGRAGLGMAVGMVMPACTTLVGHLFQGPERARVLGWQMAFMGFGGVVFLISGGLLAELSWRGPFAAYFLALLILPGVLMLPHRPDGPQQAEETAGFPWGALIWVYVAALFGMICFYALPTQLPYLLSDRGIGMPFLVGATLGLVNLTSAVTSLNYKRLRGARSSLATLGLSITAIGVGLAITALLKPFGAMLGGLGISGVAIGLMMPTFGLMVLAEAPDGMRGRASGLLTTFIFIGQFISADLLALVSGGGSPTMRIAIIAASAVVIGMILSIMALLRARRRAPQSELE